MPSAFLQRVNELRFRACGELDEYALARVDPLAVSVQIVRFEEFLRLRRALIGARLDLVVDLRRRRVLAETVFFIHFVVKFDKPRGIVLRDGRQSVCDRRGRCEPPARESFFEMLFCPFRILCARILILTLAFSNALFDLFEPRHKIMRVAEDLFALVVFFRIVSRRSRYRDGNVLRFERKFTRPTLMDLTDNLLFLAVCNIPTQNPIDVTLIIPRGIIAAIKHAVPVCRFNIPPVQLGDHDGAFLFGGLCLPFHRRGEFRFSPAHDRNGQSRYCFRERHLRLSRLQYGAHRSGGSLFLRGLLAL